MSLTTKILGSHSADCTAMRNVNRGDWDSPWYFDSVEYRASNGRRGGFHRWLRFECNSIKQCNCHAAIIVREDSLIAMLPHDALRGRGGDGNG